VLCLIQIAADGELAVIDPMTVGDLTPFWEAVANAGATRRSSMPGGARSSFVCWPSTVGHRNCFDVQLAAALAGAEYPAGLGTLISKFLGRTPPKHETRTDWRRRPLSKRQVSMRERCPLLQPSATRFMQSCKNWPAGWLEEEIEDVAESAGAIDVARAVAARFGQCRARRPRLAIIRELFHWRDAEAQRRNQPVRRILRDDLIVELANAARRRRSHWRGARVGTGRPSAPDGRNRRRHPARFELPEAECPPRASREQSPELSVLGQLLFAALGSIAARPSLLPIWSARHDFATGSCIA